jgi:DNA mismatch repair protein MutL
LPIRVLPPEVAARIAAGEVVERPASIVKELLENALDAGASRISIEVSAGGVDSIRVSDDGCGVAADEIEKAFERHATSKLENDADLARVLTLGFRGEALPSIAAVAEVEMVSRPAQSESGACIRLVPEAPAEISAKGAPVGTTIAVRRLFERLPARRKFLRSAASETSAVASVVSQYALAYPEVRFALMLDGRQTLQTPGSGDLRDAVSAVYGADIAEAMLDVRGQEPGGRSQERQGISVEGLVGPPHVSRAGRGYVSLFVNGRWIQNRRLAYAVEEAYQGLLMVGRRPVAVLNLGVVHDEVDVNVHPTKAEVRLRDESAVFGAIQRAVRQTLLASSPVPVASEAPVQALRPGAAQAPLLWEHGVRIEAASTRSDFPGSPPAINGEPPAPAGTPAAALPVLRVIGQMGGTYIIAEGPDGMYLIDQHAAHERVLYEGFWRRRQEGSPEVQGLLETLSLDVSPRHRGMLGDQAEALREHGFEIEPFGESSYVLRSVPRTLGQGDVREAVRQFLDAMLEEGEGDHRDRVAMSLACHGAIRAGKTLSLEEMRELVRQLEESEAPNTCPHGRPTMIHLSADVLAREFGRR